MESSFIKVPWNTSDFILSSIKKKYSHDMDCEIELKEKEKIDGKLKSLQTIIKKDLQNEKIQKVISIGCDFPLTVSFVNAYKELESDKNNKINVIFFGNKTYLGLLSTLKYCDRASSFLLESNKESTKFSSNNMFYFGIDNTTDEEDIVLQELAIEYYPLKSISEKDFKEQICEVIEPMKDSYLHVCFNVDIFDSVPAYKFEDIFGLMGPYIDSMEIIGLPKIDKLDTKSKKDKKVNRERKKIKYTLKSVQNCISWVLNKKQKNINIFSEDSTFLIYRPREQTNKETDIGWYIMRGMTLEQRNELSKRITDDEIISKDIEGTEYYITKTSVNYQNSNLYYTAKTIFDTVLFPQEKESMVFELINV
jgi:hypothetical protein